jgi:AraC family transcriptional regulator
MFPSSTAHSADLFDNWRVRSANAPWRPRPAGRNHNDPARQSNVPRGCHSEEDITPSVEVTPDDVARRSTFSSNGVFAEVIRAGGAGQVEYRFRGTSHLLVCGGGIRADGESWVEGLPRSSVRDLRRKLTFVPAGCEYYERRDHQRATPTLYVYFNPIAPPTDQSFDDGETELRPRLLFEDFALWTTAMKLQSLLENPSEDERNYADALVSVLRAEIIRHNRGERKIHPRAAGGLAAWQQRVVSEFIEARISQQLPIATLAELARLSQYHFCRAFKVSFGVPPHRYHVIRRMERAKQLLSDPSLSVTAIGIALGFSDTASFSASFRKITGLSPTQYQRGVV